MNLDLVLRRILLVGVVLIGLVVLRQSLHYVDFVPYVGVDDSIGNVAVSLADHGRYGFLSSPTQGPHEVDRTRAFYNYGPLYFYVGAAFTWFFGPSVRLFRMLHPLGLFTIVSIFLLTFRRVSAVGVAFFALALYTVYLYGEFPVGRPDIMVSVCIAIMLCFAAPAISKGSWPYWLGVGFFAASAATSHLIAVGVIPASVIICAAGLMKERSLPLRDIARIALPRFGALAAGGFLGVLLFLVAIDFRVPDLLALGTAGVHEYARPWFETLQLDWMLTWAFLTPLHHYVVDAGFLGAIFLTGAALLIRRGLATEVSALVMPPVVTALCYILGKSYYGNLDPAYEIASHVTVLWAIGAAISVVIALLIKTAPAIGHIMHRVLASLAIIALASAIVAWSSLPTPTEDAAVGKVSIADYSREVLTSLPERASVWGSLYFGVDSGDRTDLVAFLQMFNAALDFPPAQREKIAPGFLSLSNYETEDSSAWTFSGQTSYYDNFERIFPTTRYVLTRIVCAPPYGCTRDYERSRYGGGLPTANLPTIAVNDGSGRQWSSRLGAPMRADFKPSAPVAADVSIYSTVVTRKALDTVAGELPGGTYLLRIALPPERERRGGIILATPGEYFYWPMGIAQFAFPAAPYFVRDRVVDIVVDHLGGPLYISRFEKDSSQKVTAPMRVISVRPILIARDISNPPPNISLAPPATWQRTQFGRATALPGGAMRISGSLPGGAPVLQSPPLSLQAGQRYMLSIPTAPRSGAVDVAVVRTDGSLLVPSTLMPLRLVFQTRQATQARVVVVNGGNVPLDVTISAGSLVAIFPNHLYVDRLMIHRAFGHSELSTKPNAHEAVSR